MLQILGIIGLLAALVGTVFYAMVAMCVFDSAHEKFVEWRKKCKEFKEYKEAFKRQVSPLNFVFSTLLYGMALGEIKQSRNRACCEWIGASLAYLITVAFSELWLYAVESIAYLMNGEKISWIGFWISAVIFLVFNLLLSVSAIERNKKEKKKDG